MRLAEWQIVTTNLFAARRVSSCELDQKPDPEEGKYSTGAGLDACEVHCTFGRTKDLKFGRIPEVLPRFHIYLHNKFRHPMSFMVDHNAKTTTARRQPIDDDQKTTAQARPTNCRKQLSQSDYNMSLSAGDIPQLD